MKRKDSGISLVNAIYFPIRQMLIIVEEDDIPQINMPPHTAFEIIHDSEKNPNKAHHMT